MYSRTYSYPASRGPPRCPFPALFYRAEEEAAEGGGAARSMPKAAGVAGGEECNGEEYSGQGQCR